MSTLLIEKELNNSLWVNDFEVDLDHEKNLYKVYMKTINPQDSEDIVGIFNLKKKIRGVVNHGFKIKFTIEFTT